MENVMASAMTRASIFFMVISPVSFFFERQSRLGPSDRDGKRNHKHPHGAERAARAGRPLTPDLTPGGGVLCAVQSCLRHLERPCLVIPCDMPFLTEGVLLALLAARDEGLAAGCPPGVTLFRRAETGRLEPMVAVYEPAGLPFLDAASARGDYGLFRALPPERRIYLDYDEKDDWMFYNVNTPADLEAARRARLP